jgi:hypothetical protein
MKLTRKLIPAMIMLLVSAVLMSTASYAWFAMNTNVTASGMEVKAKADSIFLEISGTKDKEVVEGETVDKWGTAGTNKQDAVAELYPVAHNTFTAVGDVATPGNWFYKYATEATSSTAAEGNGTPLQNSLTGYVYVTTFKVRLNPNLVQAAANLRVTDVDLPDNTGISVVFASDTSFQEFKGDYAATQDENGNPVIDKVLLADMGKDVETITVYIYIDGANANVYTNNAAKLFGEITFQLSVSAK